MDKKDTTLDDWLLESEDTIDEAKAIAQRLLDAKANKSRTDGKARKDANKRVRPVLPFNIISGRGGSR